MESRPNVLWITLESVRADHTSLYGYRRETTPNLQRLAARNDATALDPVISASMWTPASTASMLSGTHMSTHLVGSDGTARIKFPTELDTLPELLAGAGYETALFSPNGNIGAQTGLDKGFDHVENIFIRKRDFLGLDSLARDSIRCAIRRAQEYPGLDPRKIKKDIGRSQNSIQERRIARWLGSGSRSNPFFVYAHVQSPHHNYDPISRYRNEYTGDLDISATEAADLVREIYADSEEIKRRMATGLELSEAEWDAIEAMYDAEIAYADYTTKRLVSIAEAASDRPLVVVVVGDHGDLFGECGLIGHNLVLHDGLISVPGLVIGIDHVVDTEDTVTQHIDLTSTVAAIADVQTDQFQGRDIRDSPRPYAISQRGSAQLDAYIEHDESFDTSAFFENEFTCVRTPQWKYLENEDRAELYRLPDEKTSVIGDHPDVANELSGIIDQENIHWSTGVEREPADFDERTKRRLEELGYHT